MRTGFCLGLLVLSSACRREEAVVLAADATTDANPPDSAVDTALDVSPAVWAPIPGWEQCQVFARRSGLETVLPRKWADCGAGCTVATAATPGWSRGLVAVATGAFRGTDVLLRTGSADPTNALQLSRLSDGVTLALVEIRGPVTECGALGADNVDSPDLFALYGGKPAAVGAVRIVDGVPLTSALRDASGKLTVNQFSVGSTGWGVGARSGVYVAADSAATAWKQLDSAEPYGVSAQGTTVVWSQFTGDASVLKASFDGKAPQVIAATAAEGAPILPVFGPARLAWVAVNGPERVGGIYTAERLAWSESLPTSGATVSVVFGPALPAGWVSAPRVGPTHVGVVACGAASEGCSLIVAEVATKKGWSIPARPSMRWRRVLAVSDHEVVALEASLDAPSWRADAIVRFELASIPSVGAPI